MDKYLQHAVGLNISYAQGIVADLTDEQMVAQPYADVTLNHPAWVLGHLCVSNSLGSQMLGHEALCPDAWDALFGMGSQPKGDASAYPSKQELLDRFARSTKLLAARLFEASDEVLQQPGPEAMREIFPVVGDYIVYDLTAHVGLHMGQLSAWRRAMGLPSVF